MEDLIKQRDGENLLSYFERITDNRKKYDLDYSEWVKLLIEKEYSSENSRKAFYVVQPFIKRLINEKVDNITDQEILNELEMKTIELEKERKKKQSINVEYNRLIREQARKELYWEMVEKAILQQRPFKIPEVKEIKHNQKEGLLAISDMHYGRKNVIKGLKGEIISEYNTEIFKERMWNLLSQTVDSLKEKNIEKLHIYNLSDCIDGLLRISQLNSLQTGVIDSIIEFSEFMATWLNELSIYVKIEYNQCWGNHDEIRVLTGKKGDFPHENANKLIMKFIETRLKDNPNVIVHNTDSPFIYQDILGMKVFGYHGEDKDLAKAVKWFRKFYKVDIDMILGGHLHSQSLTTESMGEYGDVQCIRVSSICGIDDYSVSLKSSAKAGASLFVFEEGRGKTETRDLWLN